jgi:hypothetical protein
LGSLAADFVESVLVVFGRGGSIDTAAAWDSKCMAESLSSNSMVSSSSGPMELAEAPRLEFIIQSR